MASVGSLTVIMDCAEMTDVHNWSVGVCLSANIIKEMKSTLFWFFGFFSKTL